MVVPKIFLFGIDRAGKTVLTNYICYGTLDRTFTPTLAPSPHFVVLKELKSSIWDMPGQKSFRTIWMNHVLSSELLIGVIDLADAIRFPEAKEEIEKILIKAAESLPIPPLILCFNKIDLPEAQANLKAAKTLFNFKKKYPRSIYIINTSIKQTDSLETLKNKISELLPPPDQV